MSGTVLETGDATVNHTGYNLLLYGAFCDMDKVSTNKYMYNYSGECSKHSLKTFFFFLERCTFEKIQRQLLLWSLKIFQYNLTDWKAALKRRWPLATTRATSYILCAGVNCDSRASSWGLIYVKTSRDLVPWSLKGYDCLQIVLMINSRLWTVQQRGVSILVQMEHDEWRRRGLLP